MSAFADSSDASSDAAADAASTLADLDRQIATRVRTADGDTSDPRPDGGVRWSDLEDGAVTRLAADGVISTNRGLSQRSLRDFLR